MARPTDVHPRQGRGGRPYIGGGPLGSNENDRAFARDFRKALPWKEIPSEAEFEASGDSEYLDAPALLEMAERLIGEYEELNWLEGRDVRYLWKAKGGKKTGDRSSGRASWQADW